MHEKHKGNMQEPPAGPTTLDAYKLLEKLRDRFQDRTLARGRRILVAPEREKVIMKSDTALLERVLGGLIEAALEASRQHDVIVMESDVRYGTVEFLIRCTRLLDSTGAMNPSDPLPSSRDRDTGLGDFAIFRLTLPLDASL